ncbi:YraN family protein [Chitinophaga caseinilytica]|uniref:UPF0102 protein WJU22_18465 n=1 Tax=Chitinophaga caseinilytica TaxID=2267521 RepID=A0ABZ2YYJ3_9BACT
MACDASLGNLGERLAAEHLSAAGYHILHRNWKAGRKEIDIIAEKSGTVVFVEVKTRSSRFFGMPEEAVGWKKEEHLRKVAEHWLEQNGGGVKHIRFDILSIFAVPGEKPEILHLQDVF